MARRATYRNKKILDAILSIPFIFLAPTKRQRRSAAKKWLKI